MRPGSPGSTLSRRNSDKGAVRKRTVLRSTARTSGSLRAAERRDQIHATAAPDRPRATHHGIHGYGWTDPSEAIVTAGQADTPNHTSSASGADGALASDLIVVAPL